MIRKPPAAAGIQLVVADTVSTGGGVDKATIPRIDRDMAYPSTL
jgi:hypothetical protein